MKREEVKREISRAIIVGIAAVMSMSLFACKPKEKVEKIEIPLEQSVNSNETKSQETTKQITITPEEAARGKTIENTKRTVNEYGITIYGRKIDKTEPIYSKIEDKDPPEGAKYIYTEYYSDVQGSIIYLLINEKNGGKVFFNSNGTEIGTGSKASANVDIEKILANVKMGNAMAEAIDRSVKNNK